MELIFNAIFRYFASYLFSGSVRKRNRSIDWKDHDVWTDRCVVQGIPFAGLL